MKHKLFILCAALFGDSMLPAVAQQAPANGAAVVTKKEPGKVAVAG